MIPHYYVEDFENGTLTSSTGRIDRHPLFVDSGAHRVSRERDAALVPAGTDAPDVAAPLSHGSNPNSNMAGRRREDDENLISFDAELSNQGAPDDKAILTRKLKRAISSETQGVRRLTPTECERLQALPDGWTDLGGTPDSRRYAALGDAVTATVAEWIGRRLMNAGQTEAEDPTPRKGTVSSALQPQPSHSPH